MRGVDTNEDWLSWDSARWARPWHMRLLAAGHELIGVEPHRGTHRTAAPRRRHRRGHAGRSGTRRRRRDHDALRRRGARRGALRPQWPSMDALEPGGAAHLLQHHQRCALGAPHRGACPARQRFCRRARLWAAQCGRRRQAVDRRGRSRRRSRHARGPLLEPLSRGISVVGTEPRQAHALKLGGNFLISAMIHSLGEAFVFAAVAGHRAGGLSRGRQQRALPVAVLRRLRQRDAAPARDTPAPPSSWAPRICACCAKPPPAATPASASPTTWPRSSSRRKQAGPRRTRTGPSASTAWRSSAARTARVNMKHRANARWTDRHVLRSRVRSRDSVR